MKTIPSFKPKLSINAFGKNRFFLGLSIAIFSTIIAYGFLFSLREILRLFSTTFSFPNRVWELDLFNMAIQDFVLAMLACQIGQMVFFEFCFSKSTLLPHWNFRRKTILVDNRNVLFNFLFFGLKIGVAIAFFLYTEMLGLLKVKGIIFWIFVLSIIALHLQAWTTINRTFKYANQWMLATFGLLLLGAAIMIQVPPIDYQQINQQKLNRIPDYHLNIQPPTANIGRMPNYSFRHIPFSLQIINGEVQLANQNELIKWSKIPTTIEKTKKYINPYYHQVFASLTIDKNVPMEMVFKLKHQLRVNGINKVAYTLFPPNYEFKHAYPFDRSYGFMEKVPLLCSQDNLTKSLAFLQKTNSFDTFDEDIDCIPFSFFWKEMALDWSEKTIIHMDKNGLVYIEDKSISQESLINHLSDLHYETKKLDLLLIVDHKAKYQDYITLKVAIFKAKKNVRNEVSLKKYHQPYSEDLPLAQRKEIATKHIFLVTEPNSETELKIYQELERLGNYSELR